MNNIKKYLNFDFLFPIIMVYLFMPVIGWIVGTTGIISTASVDFELLFLLGAMFLSLWWILLYYDGTAKTAALWWVRYIIMILPAWIICYCTHLNDADSYIYLTYLFSNIAGNLVTGFVGFILRKHCRDSKLLYIVIAVICIYVLRPFGAWM